MFVEVRTTVRSVPPQFEVFFPSQIELTNALGAQIITASQNGLLSELLRREARRQSATALLSANISNCNVTFVPAVSADLTGLSVSNVTKFTTTLIVGIVIASIIGLMLVGLLVKMFLRFSESKEIRNREFYTITNSDSSENLARDDGFLFAVSPQHNVTRVPSVSRNPVKPANPTQSADIQLPSSPMRTRREIIHMPKEEDEEVVMFYEERKK